MSIEADYHDAIYLYALATPRGVGPDTAYKLREAFPQPAQFLRASDAELNARLGSKLATLVRTEREQWDMHWQTASATIERHVEADITPLAVTDPRYPALLRLTPDRPTILYVKGSIEAVQMTRAIAVIGTREPTPLGPVVAQRVARHFAGRGFCIVSGLAKGIDTAGHQGALEAQDGRTVAVFGTPLDTVYPAQNKRLAEEICEQGGALVSEYALESRTFRGAFAARDRIQAGLSLAVIVVQTRIGGGSMIAVGAAHAYQRPILCPKPLIDQEGDVPQYAGIKQVIAQGAQVFTSDDYAALEALLQEEHQRLVPDGPAHQPISPTAVIGSARKSNVERDRPRSTLWPDFDA